MQVSPALFLQGRPKRRGWNGMQRSLNSLTLMFFISIMVSVNYWNGIKLFLFEIGKTKHSAVFFPCWIPLQADIAAKIKFCFLGSCMLCIFPHARFCFDKAPHMFRDPVTLQTL